MTLSTQAKAATAAMVLAASMGAQAFAKQVWSDPADVSPGHYRVETKHTQVLWGASHFGLTTYYGLFSGASGDLTLDPKDPARSQLSIRVPVATVSTTSAELDGKLKSAAWLDAAKYPTMEFVSTRVELTGAGLAQVTGNLTLHGVTRKLTLAVKFNGAAINPLDRAYSVGFAISGDIRRSDFGITTLIPMVGDDVTLIIAASFEKN